MYYKRTKSQIAGTTAITLFVIFLFSMYVYEGLNKAEGKGTTVNGIVIESVVNTGGYDLHLVSSVRIKLNSGNIVSTNISVNPEIIKGTKVILKRYKRSISGYEYRLYKYHTKDGLKIVRNPINEAY